MIKYVVNEMKAISIKIIQDIQFLFTFKFLSRMMTLGNYCLILPIFRQWSRYLMKLLAINMLMTFFDIQGHFFMVKKLLLLWPLNLPGISSGSPRTETKGLPVVTPSTSSEIFLKGQNYRNRQKNWNLMIHEILKGTSNIPHY